MIIEYKKPIPKDLKKLYERAAEILFEGAKVIWSNNNTILTIRDHNCKIKLPTENG